MNRILNQKQVDAVYASNIRCILNHDVSGEDLQKIWEILLKNADNPGKEK